MPDVARPYAASNALEDTGQMPALFVRERQPTPPPPPRATGPDFDRIQHGKEFVALRKTFRRFVFPMSLLFFTWYMTFVLLAAYAHDFMSRKVWGEVNVGILLGLGQFASTILITIAYLKFANKRLDPKVEALRAAVGAGER
ncbi:DUF485 domain-containing protein [Amycolatopsis sp. WAC 01375]|uniref:DUF485 domain-containing protein n=1 Tax=unclassified Amycolatopsis TaxID=2618356 RepID=UPI000F7A65AA|nr:MULTISPECIES: DUF485 domain-containing protein [unclassified Amycolatopsis]RSM78469.1 DUF485 domain-containing protein [Amycolatopsis sp. WAC 01375]RSN30931.1 DUF485 domain-containing protein [Amycolatopsis sp. WAC 01416]